MAFTNLCRAADTTHYYWRTDSAAGISDAGSNGPLSADGDQATSFSMSNNNWNTDATLESRHTWTTPRLITEIDYNCYVYILGYGDQSHDASAAAYIEYTTDGTNWITLITLTGTPGSGG